jgi:hypothetical protein
MNPREDPVARWFEEHFLSTLPPGKRSSGRSATPSVERPEESGT